MPVTLTFPILAPAGAVYTPTEDNYRQIAERVTALVATLEAPLPLTLQCHLQGFTDAEKLNFLSLLQKSWPHLIFIAGIQSSARVQFSVWRHYTGAENNLSEAVSQYTRHFRDRIQILLGDPTSVILNVLRSDSGVPAIMSFVRRIPMLADWAKKYSTETKLTSPANLKWATFEEITKFGRRGIVARPQRQSVTESSDDSEDSSEDDDD